MSVTTGIFSAAGETGASIQLRPNNSISYTISAAASSSFIGTIKSQTSRNGQQWNDIATHVGTSAAPISSSAQQTSTYIAGATDTEYFRLASIDVDALSNAATWSMTPGDSDNLKAYLIDGRLQTVDGTLLLGFTESGTTGLAGGIGGVSDPALRADLDAHIADTADPHAVTGTQVGLGNVLNVAQLAIANNLSDVANAATARTNLALGTAALEDVQGGGSADLLRADGSGAALTGLPGGVNTFTGLIDAPSSYASAAGKMVVVTSAASALAFSAVPAAGVSTFTGMADVPSSYASAAGKMVVVNSAESALAFAVASAVTFAGLTDTPSSYASAAGKMVVVNSAASALAFSAVPAGVSTFTGLADVPSSYASAAGKMVVVNSAGSALAFAASTSATFAGLTDTPSSYASAAGQMVVVKGDVTGLEFVGVPAIGSGISGKTVFDYGAIGNGAANDGPAIQAALQAAMDQQIVVRLPGGYSYRVSTPITVTTTAAISKAWGLVGGGKIISAITGGQNVIKMNINHLTRYMRLDGWGIDGNGGVDGHCIYIKSNGGQLFMCVIANISLNRPGKNGLRIEGNCFETGIFSLLVLDSEQESVYLAHDGLGGIVSSIVLYGPQIHQSKTTGILVTNLLDPAAAAYDVRVIGGYLRDNRGPGIEFKNGSGPGGGLTGVGFENNWKITALASGNAHVHAATRINMSQCFGHTMDGGSKYLFKGYLVASSVLRDCAQTDDGAANGLTKLAYLQGNSSAHMLMDNCSGGFTEDGGYAGTWAEFDKTYPLGRNG